ncbi:MAG: amidohydrolase family protein, partial [Syntrophales bacterium]|nr:amidohydrolase family protein [Syntrophales bacterium]
SRYPTKKMIFPHLGSLVYAEFGKLLDDYPNLCLDTSYTFIPNMPGGFLSSSLGIDFLEKYQDRILYGSDFPNVLFPREVEIETLLGLNLSQSFYDKIFRGNGREILTGQKI